MGKAEISLLCQEKCEKRTNHGLEEAQESQLRL